MDVLGTRWWQTCRRSSLFITIPPLWKSKPCLQGTMWSDMTISNETKCKLWTSMKPHNCCFKLKPSFLTYRFCVASLKKSNFSSGPGRWKYSWGTSGTHFFTFTSSVKTVLSPTGKKSVTHTHHKPPKVVLLGTFLQIFKHFESSLSTSQWWAQQNSQEVDDVATRPNSTLLQLSADLCPMRRYGLSPKFWGSWWGQAKLSTFSSFRYSGFFVTELHLPGNFGGDKEATSFLSRNRLLEHLSLHPSLRTLVSWMLQSLQGLWIHSQPLLTGTAYVHSGHSKQESVPIWKPFGLNKVYP